VTSKRPGRWQALLATLSALPGDERGRVVGSAAAGDDEALALLTETLESGSTDGFLATGRAFDGLLWQRLESELGGDATADSRVGSKIGRVRVESVLGSGGMGDVYRGFDEALERPVALKALAADRRYSPAGRELLLREARVISSLDHPGICRIHDLLEHGDEEFLVLELVEGATLRELDREALGRDEVLGLGIQILDALAAAHAAGIIHRDLKPDNVMRTPEGGVRILDFGIARLADAAEAEAAEGRALVGTARYLSPEQARGEALTPATDIYSFGLLFQELLTGRPAYGAITRAELVAQAAAAAREPTQLGSELDGFLSDLTAADPESRPTAGEARQRLAGILEGPRRRRRRALRWAVAALTVAALAAAGWSLFAWRRASREAELAGELTDRVLGIREQLQRAHLAPRHDIRPEYAVARARLAALEERIAREGTVARRPGAAAVGRAHLLLGEPEPAREQLERAWDAGWRSAVVALDLGRAFGQLYELALAEARGMPPGRDRERALELARTRYRDPALDLLRRAEGVEIESPELVEALIALYEGRFEAALEGASAARRKRPGLYESELVTAEARIGLGRRQRGEGDHEAALGSLEQAREGLLAAAEVARSDARIHQALCRLGGNILATRILGRGGDLRPDYEGGVEACAAAAAIDPDWPDLLVETANLHTRFGESLLWSGGDPGELFALAIDQIERALEIRTRASTLDSLGVVHDLVGAQLFMSGGDPLPEVDKALAAYRRALELEPGRVSTRSNMTYSLWVKAQKQIMDDAVAYPLFTQYYAMAKSKSFDLGFEQKSWSFYDPRETSRILKP